MKLISGADNLPCNLSAPPKTARKRERDVHCTLCGNSMLTSVYPKNDHRYYYHCNTCRLIFAAPRFHPSAEIEVVRYLEHNNGIDQPGYVTFLNRVIEPACSFIRPGAIGLDYGCGPVPTLSKLILQKGITCYDFDPLFNFDHPLESYDFIFATECLEHFHYPKNDIEKILELLKPDGYLCLMTERWENLVRFQNWYYKLDPTHVSFFHRDTFEYIKKRYGLKHVYSDRNRVIILRKN